MWCVTRKSLYMQVSNNNTLILLLNVLEQLRTNGIKGKKREVTIIREFIHIEFAVFKHGKPFNPEYKNRF